MTTPDPGERSRVTLLQTMQRALARVPQVLADEPAREALLAMAQMLPAEFLEGPLGLEFRLRGPRTVDFFAAAQPQGPSYQALCTALRQPLGEVGWLDPGRADDLAQVLQRWAAGTGALPAVARYLLVEVDAPAAPSAPVAVPSIFLAPRASRDANRPGQPPNAFQQRTEATTMAVAELSGVWPDPRTAQAFAEVVATLPAEADVFAVGAMVSRQAGSSMRVAIRRIRPEGIHEVLTAAGLAPQAEVVAAWAAGSPVADHAVAFEVGPGAESRVGLELSPSHDWKEARTDEWPALLDYVAQSELAEPDRLAAVPGLIDAVGDPLWGLAHVKFAVDQSGVVPGCKLYVGFIAREALPTPLPRRSSGELCD
ncbi:MAG: hypothetical protein QG597_3733 [Actinomycetota bacterium]|nr:hypothetical protein [Actinomycetota bacterium]